MASLFEKLRWPLLVLAVVLVGGTTGYHLIEGWSWLDSFWMVTITLTTIGFGEVHELSPIGRLYTIGIIFTGVGLLTYSLGQVSRYVVEGELQRNLQARRRKRVMEKLANHYVVVGYGRLGREVAEELTHRGQKVIAIDLEAQVLEGLSDLAMTIVGDGSSDDLLRTAALGRARGLAVATGSDATNIFVTLSARQMNPDLHILTRVDEEESARKAYRAGANAVVNPYGISGARMAQGLLHPHAAQVLDQAVGRAHDEFQIGDIVIGDAEAYHGKLGELDIPERHKVLIVALRKPDGRLLTATDRNTELQGGDIAIVVGRPSDLEEFEKAARGPG